MAGAKVINFWLPGVPTWVLSLVLMLLMTGTNLISVSSFGEFEFWFAGIKVARSSSFLICGGLFRLRHLAQREPRLQQPHGHGGFFPNGGLAVTAGVVTRHLLDGRRRDRDHRGRRVERPRAGREQGRNSVITRIAIFFVGSIFLLAVILPWNSSTLEASPYVAAFQEMASRTPTTS